MSHFTVLVTKTDKTPVDEQLEPFYEQGDEDDYFMEHDIQVATDKMEEEARKIVADEYVQKDDKLRQRYTGYLSKNDFISVCKDWHGGEIDDEGNLYFLRNPNAKWDWYVVGGRWTGYFKLRSGAKGELGRPGTGDNKPRFDADIAKVKDIDWTAMEEADRAKAEKNWAEYEAKLAAGEKVSPYWDYGIEKDDTKDTFIKRRSSVATFAVLHNGEWYEKGEMGWWAMVSNEKSPEEWQVKFDEIIASLDPEDEVTVVDAHI